MRRTELAMMLLIAVGCGAQEQAVGPSQDGFTTQPSGQTATNQDARPQTVAPEAAESSENTKESKETADRAKEEAKEDSRNDDNDTDVNDNAANNSDETRNNTQDGKIFGAANLIQTFLQLFPTQYNSNYNLTWLRQECQQAEARLTNLFNQQIYQTYDQYQRNLINQQYQRQVYDIRTRCQLEERRMLGYR